MEKELKEQRISQILHFLECPCCESSMTIAGRLLNCRRCGKRFPFDEEIPQLFWSPPQAGDPVTQKVKAFYEENPFPDYEDFDDLASLIDKARQGIFARLLDEQIPFGSRVLECGCGTGQLCNFLGIAHRTLIGTDISNRSLALAEDFRSRHGLERVYFLQMNLFHPVFPAGSFDVVICNGVLHHTASPRNGFAQLARLVRPGGFLIVGLYHRWGRIMTDVRRRCFRLFGEGLSFLDPRLRKTPLGQGRRRAWFADQYRNPHESKHTIGEVLGWLEEEKLRLVKTLPKTRFLQEFSEDEQLFEPEIAGTGLERRFLEFTEMFTGDREGGFFTMIAQKKL